MRKLLCGIITLVVCFCTVCFVGCSEDETQKQIQVIQTQLQQITEKLATMEEANGILTTQIDELSTQIDELTDQIDELEIKNSKGKFFTLSEAYESRLITRDALKNIAYYNNGGREGNEQIFFEDFKPAAKDPEVLNDKTQEIIKQAYLNFYYADNLKVERKGVSITQYFGIYNICVAVIISDVYHYQGAVVTDVNIDGVYFRFPNNEVLIYYLK